MAKVDRQVFRNVKKDLKAGEHKSSIMDFYGLSQETIRLIKNCPSWAQWEQDKVNRYVMRQNKKYEEQQAKTLKGKIKSLFKRKK